jgi:hypothetical protein
MFDMYTITIIENKTNTRVNYNVPSIMEMCQSSLSSSQQSPAEGTIVSLIHHKTNNSKFVIQCGCKWHANRDEKLHHVLGDMQYVDNACQECCW